MNNFYLSIDLALNKTGVVLLFKDKVHAFKIIKNKTTESLESKLKNLEINLINFINNTLNSDSQVIILIEKPYLKIFNNLNIDTTYKMIFTLGWIVNALVKQNIKKKIFLINNQQWKKFFSPQNMSKETTTKTINSIFSLDIKLKDHDLADCVAMYYAFRHYKDQKIINKLCFSDNF
ncbi:hypothetical protein [Mycoplasma sp. SG1]|uniref:hypothetical protein n=1 Tax=Mycoplasma sp. SG1 TaxID=2810348 RepID=UPI0020241165|nr:hypothetical protein [Mycoplasma sp. SG1]URM52932.1 hypothetical protein JRW51_01125 [Mycoplasma sp. SG1]